MLDIIGPLAQPQDADGVAGDALAGLARHPKSLPAKLFYDAEGCRLFGLITELPEYYLTRTERALLAQLAPDIAAAAPEGAALVEYGASSETKALVLIEHLREPRAYVPIDVAAGALEQMAQRMAGGGVTVLPIAADFLEPLMLPPNIAGMPRLGFFPGSTIGNLAPDVAIRFLRQARTTLGDGALFVVGADLRKDPSILIPAYDDAAGVTAAFNKNILARLNREVGADFDLDTFRHEARWNAADSRIEMHLVSERAQTVRVCDATIRFAEGESIHTEDSYKLTLGAFRALALRAGWRRIWSRADAAALFGIHLLQAGPPG
ncbi:MAG TPA: L-histidine N(alpha)-methyltransferase [Acetobacteraceae bacterium]|nr:L-histidine N(alpha)-methyltransferase [Acetobacteraceae bacterium]